jgi:hypothetical protein
MLSIDDNVSGNHGISLESLVYYHYIKVCVVSNGSKCWCTLGTRHISTVHAAEGGDSAVVARSHPGVLPPGLAPSPGTGGLSLWARSTADPGPLAEGWCGLK